VRSVLGGPFFKVSKVATPIFKTPASLAISDISSNGKINNHLF